MTVVARLVRDIEGIRRAKSAICSLFRLPSVGIMIASSIVAEDGQVVSRRKEAERQ